MSRIANQIISVCGWLVNFQPVLIPPPSGDLEVVDLCLNRNACYIPISLLMSFL